MNIKGGQIMFNKKLCTTLAVASLFTICFTSHVSASEEKGITATINGNSIITPYSNMVTGYVTKGIAYSVPNSWSQDILSCRFSYRYDSATNYIESVKLVSTSYSSKAPYSATGSVVSTQRVNYNSFKVVIKVKIYKNGNLYKTENGTVYI